MNKTTPTKPTTRYFLLILIASVALAFSAGAFVTHTFFNEDKTTPETAILTVVKNQDAKTSSVKDIEYADAFARGMIVGDNDTVRGMFIVKFENGHWTYVTTSFDGIGKTTGESLGLPSAFYSDSDEY